MRSNLGCKGHRGTIVGSHNALPSLALLFERLSQLRSICSERDPLLYGLVLHYPHFSLTSAIAPAEIADLKGQPTIYDNELAQLPRYPSGQLRDDSRHFKE